MTILYQTETVDDCTIFYREAGPEQAPNLLLLHGFPTASHMFRNLIPELSDRYHIIAPDFPGFGNTVAPSRDSFDYTFDHLAQVIDAFTEKIGLLHFAMYVFDYGAPIGYRIAVAHPERIAGIISQNGNAYQEGFGDTWGSWKKYWDAPTADNREACRESLTPVAIRDFQYMTGIDGQLVSPDGYTLDNFYMKRPEREEIQLDLILDYRNNIRLYPEFQAYFRTYQPPFLAVWGKNDPSFIPAGALAYGRDLPDAEIHLLNTGHFALETHAVQIGYLINVFLSRVI
ncbi:MAG: alpha/beta hydrolase [Sporolactobacillus sp.]